MGRHGGLRLASQPFRVRKPVHGLAGRLAHRLSAAALYQTAVYFITSLAPIDADSGAHAALRVRTSELVDAFHAAAVAAGGRCDGAPGLRPQHGEGYYAAFIRDLDGNRVEAVTFLKGQL